MIDARTLLDMGFTGKSVGEIIKASKKWTPEEVEHFLSTGERPKSGKVSVVSGSVLEWLLTNPCVKDLHGSSMSEKRRWLDSGSVEINGEKAESDDLIDWFLPFESLVFFPRSKLKITMV